MDPQQVAERYSDRDLDKLDLIRRYDVILDWSTGELIENTTAEFREMLRERSSSDWSDSVSYPARRG